MRTRMLIVRMERVLRLSLRCNFLSNDVGLSFGVVLFMLRMNTATTNDRGGVMGGVSVFWLFGLIIWSFFVIYHLTLLILASII